MFLEMSVDLSSDLFGDLALKKVGFPLQRKQKGSKNPHNFRRNSEYFRCNIQDENSKTRGALILRLFRPYKSG